MANFLINSAAVSLPGTEEKDTFQIITGASAITVEALGADDTITLSSTDLKDSVLLGNDGDDTFNLLGGSASGNALTNVSVGGSLGKDTINFGLQSAVGSLNSVTVNGGQNSDTLNGFFDVDSTASALSINGGRGDDSIEIFSAGNADIKSTLIGGGKGDDDIIAQDVSSLVSTTINGGIGEDSIFISAGSISGSVINGGSNGVEDSEEDSADEFFLNAVSVANSTILGNGGDDLISANFVFGSSWSIGGGQGKDEIIFDGFGEKVTIGGGKGDDYITANQDELSAASLIGGDGEDIINLGDTATASTTTIQGGLGADTISVQLGANFLPTASTSEVSIANFSYETFEDSTLTDLDKVNVGDVTAVTAGSDIINNFIVAGIGTVEDGTATVSGTDVVVTDGYIDDFAAAGITELTAAVEFLDAALATDEAVAFKISAGASDMYLYVQGGETDLLVNFQNVDQTSELTALAVAGKTNLQITFNQPADDL